MKRFILFLLCVLVVAISVLTGMTYLTEHFLRKQKEDIFGKVNELMDGKNSYDLLCIGSSRTLVQVDPFILDSVLSSNSYNAGLDGTTIIESIMLLKAYLQNHASPKVVVLNVEINSLNIKDTVSIFDYPLYFPYLKNQFVYQTFSEYHYPVKCLSLFPFIRMAYYNDFKKYMAIKAIVRPEGDKKSILYKGYDPKDILWRGQKLNENINTGYTDKGAKLLHLFFNTCIENGIKPVVVYAPQTVSATNYFKKFSSYKNKLSEWCAEKDILFFDYSESSISRDQKFFYDYFHLNREGAKVYSTLLAIDLKKVFVKK